MAFKSNQFQTNLDRFVGRLGVVVCSTISEQHDRFKQKRRWWPHHTRRNQSKARSAAQRVRTASLAGLCDLLAETVK